MSRAKQDACMDADGRAKHDSREGGGRAKQEARAEEARAEEARIERLPGAKRALSFKSYL